MKCFLVKFYGLLPYVTKLFFLSKVFWLSKYQKFSKKRHHMCPAKSQQLPEPRYNPDSLNNLYGGMKPSEVNKYNRFPHSAKYSHNLPTLLQGLGKLNLNSRWFQSALVEKLFILIDSALPFTLQRMQCACCP